MSVTVLNPQVHLVKETPCASFFRRRLRDPNIMTFWHCQTGQWILAYWLHKGRRIVDEIEDLGPCFEAVTENFVRMIVSNYAGVDLSRHKRRLLSKQRSRILKQTEAIMESQEEWDWLKKRTADKASIPFYYNVPFSGGQIGKPRGFG